MRTIRRAPLIVGAILLCTACRLDRPSPLPPGPSCHVQLQVEREVVAEQDRPLRADRTATRAEGKDLYAVQIYKGSIKYAYGIFDDPSRMKLELEIGKIYRIEVTVVEQATAIIASGGNSTYGAPFDLGGTGKGPGKVTNQFTKTMTTSLNNLTQGEATLSAGTVPQSYTRPPVSRFYGCLDGISPETDTHLTIPLKWVCFALSVQPQDFQEGTLEIEMEGAPKLTIPAGEPGAVTKKTFCFSHTDPSAGEWQDDDYQESIPTTIRWIKADGTVRILRENHPFVFTRKHEKILHVICSDSPSDQLFLDKESTTLQPESPEIIHPTEE